MNVILSIKNLTKQFVGTTALDDISLDVEQGSILGLIGPNGAGKTTLLRLINGLLSADSGTITLNNNPITLASANKIGYLPEERGLYDNLSVEKQIMLFARLKNGSPQRIAKVMDEYLRLFNLSGLRKRKIKELSKGNQQKVQIISALAHQPELLILDEPFSGFDPINSAILQDVIDRLHNYGTTIIISSHNMAAVEKMCFDIGMINKGKLLLSGRLDDMKEAHKHNDLLITLDAPLSDEWAKECNLIESLNPIPPSNRLKGFSYLIRKNTDISNSDFIRRIADNFEIIQFQENLPSLNDIFIQYASEQ